MDNEDMGCLFIAAILAIGIGTESILGAGFGFLVTGILCLVSFIFAKIMSRMK